jgi:AcrR family transcriptional regulator
MTPPGLRETKKARTRLALLDALTERLEERPLEEIAVKELCAEAEISEASFFNYFPKKSDLLLYFIQLWSLEVALAARKEGLQGLAAIEAVFQHTAETANRHPGLFYEVLAYQARMPPLEAPQDTPVADRLLRFPDEDTGDLPAAGLQPILQRELNNALRLGELPESADLDRIGAGAAAVFFGTPLLLRQSGPAGLAGLYGSLLDQLWTGGRAAS